ncbi:MAG: HesA/MoeB/ThiF family protein [Bacteroidetes bacterium]|nr:HesA/MoeB/ThiF family protein [Bacteroidota bacterium]
MNNNKAIRYARQLQLPQIGEAGQQLLADAKVLVIGAGGLGCPALSYLAAAGVGTLAVVDFDTLELSNLHRQPMYDTMDVGRLKSKAIADKLMLLNPEIQIFPYTDRITQLNALDIFSSYDIIVDCTDNFSTRYIINDACILLNKPFVYASVFQYEGQVAVFNYNGGPTYRCLFPQPPVYGSVPDCNTSGILGTITGVIGTLQATEVIKMICMPKYVMQNKLLTWNALTQSIFNLKIQRSADALKHVPIDKNAFALFDYPAFCGEPEIQKITAEEFITITLQQFSVVDVRDANELPQATFECVCIPFSTMEAGFEEINLQQQAIVFCNSGSRSIRAIPLLQKHFPNTEFINLQGGIQALQIFLQTNT